jgi:hypothetical protein
MRCYIYIYSIIFHVYRSLFLVSMWGVNDTNWK